MVQAEKFGKYEIVRKLSRSMTDVYLAHDTEMNRQVVLKIIEPSGDEFTQLAIEAESRGALIQRQLRCLDARILEVYEFGKFNGCFFVSMEYFEGRTLAEVLRIEHSLEPKRAARYAAEICDQLQTLHCFLSEIEGRKTAVVHGDIKPSNIQLSDAGELRLLDFGIAKAITQTHNLTRHNLGSPSYCSPERLSKAQVDQHSDLWAVGVSLYEMVAGSPPYQAEDTRKLENLIQSLRPPRALPPGCPDELKAIIGKALAGNLSQRYQSAESFKADLQAFIEDRPSVAALEPVPAESNETVERPNTAATKLANKQEPPKQALPQRKLRSDFGNVAVALLAGMLAGLLLFMPVGYYYHVRSVTSRLRVRKDYAHEDMSLLNSEWNLYQTLKKRYSAVMRVWPALSLDTSVRANLVAAGDNILDTFRGSTDATLSDFDWAKARLCYQHALEISPSDPGLKGKLALCEGYANLSQHPRVPQALLSVTSFRQAESYLPRSPDPHLGLARVYVYALHNIGQAMAEFHEAQRLGYQSGPREAEEQADGFLFRAKWEFARARNSGDDKAQAAKWLELARADTRRARLLYEPIAGFSNVSTSLERVYQDENEESKLETASLPASAHKQQKSIKHLMQHLWQ
ncbi:MAG: protein kinase [Acidobacteriaceae bacterium]|nr:protein kinase [Acidobacteriaceae bacterium]MBV8570216.1 protein kinase [Acidobacteriaceae bacterium]